MASNGRRQTILRCYKELIELIHRLPAAERTEALKEARQTVKSRAKEQDPLVASDMLKDMIERIGYLRVITPRTFRDRNRLGGRFVVRDGVVIEGAEAMDKGKRVADGKISMQEAWDYHRRLMKRQYFGKEPPRFSEPF